MRKFFYGLGVFTAVVIVAGCIGFFFLTRNGAELDAASKAYVEDTVTTVAARWNADELWRRASPNLRAITRREDLEGFFAAVREALGPMVEYRGSQGEALISASAQPTVSGRYVARAHFQNGDAELKLVVVRLGGEWMVEGFHISSSALMRKLVGTRS